jgi:hypothetical protein
MEWRSQAKISWTRSGNKKKKEEKRKTPIRGERKEINGEEKRMERKGEREKG